jgi:hypothetical protein
MMTKIFLFGFICICNSFAQNEVVKTHYPNGNVESEITLNNSIREGEAKFYFEDGTLKEERLYVNGRVTGLVKKYNPNGKLKELIIIEDGKREGPTSFFDEEGNFLKDIYFEQGIQVVEKKNIYDIEEPEKKVVENQTQQNPETPVKRQRKPNYEMPPPPRKIISGMIRQYSEL